MSCRQGSDTKQQGVKNIWYLWVTDCFFFHLTISGRACGGMAISGDINVLCERMESNPSHSLEQLANNPNSLLNNWLLARDGHIGCEMNWWMLEHPDHRVERDGTTLDWIFVFRTFLPCFSHGDSAWLTVNNKS